MKKVLFVCLCITCMVGERLTAQAVNQDSLATKKNIKEITEADDEPMMLRFEPDYAAAQLKRRNVILAKRRIIDTMDISEKKKLRPIRDLYKDTNSKRLQKAMLVDTKFEDELSDEF